MSSASNREHMEKLMMGALDGELTGKEQAEFNQMLSKDPSMKEEFEKYKKLVKVTKTMKLKAPAPEVWENYWLDVYNRIERGIGWLVFSVGLVILLTYGSFKVVEAVINDPGLAIIIKVGILLTIGGLAILFVSVAREKYFTRKHDPYKEIIR
ncbi:hypothetical protein EH223_13745 [candidate division KSB1 bacterium]|nr:hypothetical protein [candidate division KSB1 bacterium]RQW01955.1 MAG: hypothetical protein EH223_13745 [candidate division KSB1 bacterium]